MTKKHKKKINKKTVIIIAVVFVFLLIIISIPSLFIIKNNKSATQNNNTEDKISKSINVYYNANQTKCDSTETYIFSCSLGSDENLYEEKDDSELSDEEIKYKNDFLFPIVNLLNLAKKEGYFFDINKIYFNKKKKLAYFIVSSNKFEKNKILGLYDDILNDFNSVNKLKNLDDNEEDSLIIYKYKTFKYIETTNKTECLNKNISNNLLSFLLLNKEKIDQITIDEKVVNIKIKIESDNKNLLNEKLSNIKNITYLTNAKLYIGN